DHRARVADMGEVVDRRPADIHAHVIRIERHEGPLFPRQRIVKAQIHGSPVAASRASSDLISREKTASASVWLAHNLADAANGEETVHGTTICDMRRCRV